MSTARINGNVPMGHEISFVTWIANGTIHGNSDSEYNFHDLVSNLKYVYSNYMQVKGLL